MTFTIQTSKFIGLLADSLQTAETDPEAFGLGVHVASHRDGFGAEPGKTDLVAVTSTDKFVVGHTFEVVDGQIVASVWPVDSVKNVLVICKNLLAVRGKDHTVDVEVVQMLPQEEPAEGEPAPEHPGYTVTLRETPALFDTDTEFAFHANHEAAFPLRGIRDILTVQPPADDAEDTAETLWSAHVLAAISAVAKRRKAQMRFYRTPGRLVHVVQIGESWLGAAMAGNALPGEAQGEPSIDPLLGERLLAGVR